MFNFSKNNSKFYLRPQVASLISKQTAITAANSKPQAMLFLIVIVLVSLVV